MNHGSSIFTTFLSMIEIPMMYNILTFHSIIMNPAWVPYLENSPLYDWDPLGVHYSYIPFHTNESGTGRLSTRLSSLWLRPPCCHCLGWLIEIGAYTYFKQTNKQGCIWGRQTCRKGICQPDRMDAGMYSLSYGTCGGGNSIPNGIIMNKLILIHQRGIQRCVDLKSKLERE